MLSVGKLTDNSLKQIEETMELIIILKIIALLSVCACFILFLVVALIIVSKFSPSDEPFVGTTNEKKLDDEKFKVYVDGVVRGSSIVFVSMFKMWKENNEVPIIGSFDEIRKDLSGNLNLFQQNNKVLNEWVDKYNEYLKTQEAK